MFNSTKIDDLQISSQLICVKQISELAHSSAQLTCIESLFAFLAVICESINSSRLVGSHRDELRKGRQRMCAEGATKILEACKDIVNGQVDLTTWEKKIAEESKIEFDEDDETEVGK
ncbi:hypothetical protein RR48_00393 [Papilio machaon]|uniref:Uncharacterized protein n=1 Tax=Papilio machaon TaxID=76193 RepID=A0A0N1IHY8_PAPMA|nr:hypothetical protein RR48_00393 [Papilio machaon]